MSLVSAYEELRRRSVGDVRIAEPMARHTSLRIGGPADLFVVCDTLAGLSDTLDVLLAEGIPFTTVGKGTNLLVADAGVRGAILLLGKEFKRHACEDGHIRAGAACVLAYLVQDAFSRGLGGLEFAVGVPGTVGGALAMNAGGRDAWIGSVTESVTLFVPEQGLVRLRGDEISWGYRTSGLPSRGIIVEGVLRLAPADPERIRLEMERSLKRRKSTQPLGSPSAGSSFKNPDGDSAGRLIEASGLKGTKLGGAWVSDVHANFIVNDGGATAADVVGLMSKVRTTVRDAHGIELQPEVRFLGEFAEP
ncbi:MAG: UDP-N-acetylmuramate dehydrogenase [Actinomycetota bacterium]|nr:MAG: UDP-N-acetylenolpyruvoylglucosamine [Actinomycetota bacterium]MDO8949648.1 UDP-N-acetylmuramate dehydrogenase [Actinomycetota bacterium]MDP3630856.1 UDP-N-acetylmuramate dehydrogenase [Actinomycetota bacterium]